MVQQALGNIAYIRFSTILQRERQARAGTDQPRLRQISNIARKILRDNGQEYFTFNI